MTSRCEDPDDFSDGRRVTTWLTMSWRNVITIGVVQLGSQRTDVAVKRPVGMARFSQDQTGEGPGKWWVPGDNPDTSGRW